MNRKVARLAYSVRINSEVTLNSCNFARSLTHVRQLPIPFSYYNYRKIFRQLCAVTLLSHLDSFYESVIFCYDSFLFLFSKYCSVIFFYYGVM